MGKPLELARDLWLPVAIAALSILDTAEADADEPALRRAAMLTVLLVLCVVLGWRRRRPGTVAVVVAGLTFALVIVLQPDLSAQPPFSPFLAVVAALFSLGMHAERRTFVAAATVCAATLGALEAAQVLAGRDPADTIPSLLFWTVAAGTGRLVHLSRSETRSERARAVNAEAERDLHAREAAVAERSRIARELHDVVAHSLSVMVIQASVEARLLGDRDDSTAQTLRSIESAGRDALVELRRLLGLLRTDEDAAVLLQPLPSLASLVDGGGMLDDVRRAGHAVTLEVRGNPGDLPASVDLSAYRVVQEALTNVVKHAPGSAIRVQVDHDDTGVRVEVTNTASGGPGPDLGSGGHGLAGMQERVRLYAGELITGRTGDGRWTVQARFPLAAERV